MLSMRRPPRPTTPVVPARTVARGLGLVAAAGVAGVVVSVVLGGASGFATWAAMLWGMTGLLVGATSVLGAATVVVLVPTRSPARSVGVVLAAAVVGALTAAVVLAEIAVDHPLAVAAGVFVVVLVAAAVVVRRGSV